MARNVVRGRIFRIVHSLAIAQDGKKVPYEIEEVCHFDHLQ